MLNTAFFGFSFSINDFFSYLSDAIILLRIRQANITSKIVCEFKIICDMEGITEIKEIF